MQDVRKAFKLQMKGAMDWLYIASHLTHVMPVLWTGGWLRTWEWYFRFQFEIMNIRASVLDRCEICYFILTISPTNCQSASEEASTYSFKPINLGKWNKFRNII